MDLEDFKSHAELACTQQSTSPAYAAESDRVALAGAVSVAVVQFRASNQLTQTQFARLLGWQQPHVARLERGDVTPSLDSLQRLARAGVLRVSVDREGTTVHSAGDEETSPRQAEPGDGQHARSGRSAETTEREAGERDATQREAGARDGAREGRPITSPFGKTVGQFAAR
ncbi:helix-turn-helix domain-containing protein [Leucobacter komagatae]|uniref:HTH cro/C1-type domain-containing protein n=1 Tax=Leucobacter komagatae TaxID=55969 RepID=A0A0D0INK0_9MICO|nr:helix-turn-helix transcriptional regulator [Leucobacter komagatae]KIP53144.1 hypothetical protein SD72_04725 [Leucobacter komagatae]